MKRRNALSILAAAAAFTLAVPAFAFQATEAPATMEAPADGGEMAEMPSAGEIIDKYIEATGGREAYEAVENERMTANLEIPEIGVTDAKVVIIMTTEPGQMFVEAVVPGVEESTTGFNGDVAWSVSLSQGARLIEGNELEVMKESADPDTLLDYEEHFNEMEVLGKEDVDGSEAYEVRLVSDAGEMTRFFDVDSGLMVKEVRVAPSPMGEMETTTTMTDYKAFGEGPKVPTKIVSKTPFVTQILTVKDVEMNIDIDESKFEPPAEVQALLGEKDAAEKDGMDEMKDAAEEGMDDAMDDGMDGM